MISCVDRLQILLEEVSILKSRFKPEDTGHLRTAVNVLNERIKEVKENIESKLDENYLTPSNDA
tara:strand:+ start:575 stop:766 length:192 start_codon:yes stop_codon:yes gene_type:complete